MSKQVEQIRAEVERRIKSWKARVKYEGDAGDCQSRVTELTDLRKFIDALPKEEGPKKPYFDKEYIESKIKAFSEAHKGETAEQIEAECRGEEAPIEVEGKKVVVRYEDREFRHSSLVGNRRRRLRGLRSLAICLGCVARREPPCKQVRRASGV